MTRPERRQELLGLVTSLVILAVVVALRVPSESQWLDEAFTRAAIGDFWGYADSRGGNMFVYMVVVRGFATVSTATWWLRMPSVLAAAGALVLLRPVARRIGGSRLVMVALPALALSVSFQWAATDARAYSLEILITVASWLCAFAALEDGSRHRRWWWVLALLGGVGVGVHGFFWLQLIPIAMLIALRRGIRRAAADLWPSVLVSLGILLIFFRAGTVGRVGISTTGGVGRWIGETMSVFVSSNAVAKVVVLELTLVGVVAAYVRVRRIGLRRSWRPVVPLLWMFVPVIALGLVSVWVNRFSARYVIGSLPGVALVIAVAVVWLADKIRTKAGAVWESAFAVVVAGVLVFTAAATPYPWRQDWRGVVELVAGEARPGDGIVFADVEGQYPEFTRPGFEGTWQESARSVTPDVLSHRRPLDQVRIDDQVLSTSDVAAQAATGVDRIWYVQLLTGHDLVNNIDLITSDDRMEEYGRVDRWCFEGPILVELWERGVTSASGEPPRSCA